MKNYAYRTEMTFSSKNRDKIEKAQKAFSKIAKMKKTPEEIFFPEYAVEGYKGDETVVSNITSKDDKFSFTVTVEGKGDERNLDKPYPEGAYAATIKKYFSGIKMEYEACDFCGEIKDGKIDGYTIGGYLGAERSVEKTYEWLACACVKRDGDGFAFDKMFSALEMGDIYGTMDPDNVNEWDEKYDYHWVDNDEYMDDLVWELNDMAQKDGKWFGAAEWDNVPLGTLKFASGDVDDLDIDEFPKQDYLKILGLDDINEK